MKAFRHVNVSSVEEAVGILQEGPGKARIIAGGTDLLGVLKDRILPDYPETLVNIKTIPGLDRISEDGSGLKIGPLAKLADIVRSPLLNEKYPMLVQAARSVATPQIRNMGTIGGNLAQDTRCWYYRYPHEIGGRISCLRKGSGPCLAVGGDNRYHAIIGGKGCFAACPSDLATALAALDAVIIIAGPDGERTVSIPDFFKPLGNILAPEEMMVEIRIPGLPVNSNQHFIKYTLRQPVDFAVVSVAALAVVADGVCTESRMALGAVAPGPLRATEAEQFLNGKRPDESVLREAADLAVNGVRPLSKNEYKVEIAKALAARVLGLVSAQH